MRNFTLHPFFPIEEENSAQFERWLDLWAQIIRPGTHTLEEAKEYFLSRYDVTEFPPDSPEFNAAKESVLRSNYSELLPERTIEIPTTEEEERQFHQEAFREREFAKKADPESCGLQLFVYRIERTEKSKSLYDLVDTRHRLRSRNEPGVTTAPERPIIVDFELASGALSVSNEGSDEVMLDLQVFMGVSEEDIRTRSEVFKDYIGRLYYTRRISGPDGELYERMEF